MKFAILTREFPPDEYGGAGVHVPYHVTWELELVEPEADHDFPVLASISELPACIEAMDGTSEAERAGA